MKAIVIGAGLAGSEAAWQIAQRGIAVTVYEMRPTVTTKAHKTAKCAELVCSNSLRGASLNNAVGLLKEELRRFGSLIMQAADAARVPAGGALAVDRELFSSLVDQQLREHSLVNFCQEEVSSIPLPDSGTAVGNDRGKRSRYPGSGWRTGTHTTGAGTAGCYRG